VGYLGLSSRTSSVPYGITIVEREGDRLVVEDDQHMRASVRAPGARQAVGDDAMIAVRAAAVTVDPSGSAAAGLNSADCEVVFVEFLGDLVKLHLLAGGERMLAKVGAEQYPALRGREGQQVWISWKEEDGQLLDA
jgi:hypothetical protein